MEASNFKVIVVGGGPVGLTAAHALEKAGIDFLVLERRPEIVIDAGSNLVLSPVGMRALYQLGLRHALDAVSSKLGRIDRLDHSGCDIGDLQIFNQMEKTMGMAPRVISRHDLTKVLYESLPPQAQRKILGNKKLSSITPTDSGVVATCADGSIHSGTMVIGADGAHSVVRDLMRTLALGSGSTEINAETPFLTTYRCLWIRFPSQARLPVGTTCETHGRNAATQLFVGEESGVTGVYERLERPTKERLRHTQADQDALVERWGHLPVTPGAKHTLRDLYASRLESGLVSLEEGVVDHWSWGGRIVLAGDAAHKFTPSTGAGCNNGMIDIVSLVNELHAVAKTARSISGCPHAVPAREELASAFRAYQETRHDVVASECATSGQATTTATWGTGVHKFVDRHIISRHILQRLMITLGASSVLRTPVFDFVAQQDDVKGRGLSEAPAPHALVSVY